MYLCTACERNSAVWANGLCDLCNRIEREAQKREVNLLTEQLSFMEQHKNADALVFSEDHVLLEAVYRSPIGKTLPSKE